MLIDDGDGVLENLRGAVAVFLSVLMERELVLVIAQLAEQTLAEIAATYAGRIELANHFQGFVKIFYRETSGLGRTWCRMDGGGGRGSNSGGSVSIG
jgi:hypothetical protein